MEKVKTLNVRQLIEEATANAGGLRSLARALDWHAGAITKIRSDEKLSPYRAAQIADLTGRDPVGAVIASLADGSKSDGESKYWSDMPAAMASAVGEVAADALRQLGARWEEIGEIPPLEIQAEMLREFLEIELPKRWTFDVSAPSTIKKAG